MACVVVETEAAAEAVNEAAAEAAAADGDSGRRCECERRYSDAQRRCAG